MIPCVSQTTTLPKSFAEDLEHYTAADCRAIEVWLTKLERHLEEFKAQDTIRALQDRGIRLVAASYQGGLLTSQGEERRVHFDHFRSRLDLCQAFGIPTLIVTADPAPQLEVSLLGRAAASLSQAAQWAAAFGVRLALEFRANSGWCACLDTALTLIEQCREPNVGVCLDVFHYYKGPSKPEDLNRLTTANLFHVQLCDVAGIPREFMGDSDRIFPGDGEFQLDPIIRRLKELGYQGAVSLELMNPELWSVNPQQVVELGLSAIRRCLQV